MKGEGNQQDYGMRVYDPRLGRFLSVDPLSAEYPWNSTYAFAENDVIRSIDLDGAEREVKTYSYKMSGGKTVLQSLIMFGDSKRLLVLILQGRLKRISRSQLIVL